MRDLQIRPIRAGEEPLLREVFYSSVHGVARSHYSMEQRNVWAPKEYDFAVWAERIRRNRPFVAERDGTIAGFADVQPDGYIDQFFVAEHAAGRGIGGALMRSLEQHARSLSVARLRSNVSLNAQPFFRHFGFSIETEQTVVIQGIALANARMFKILSADESLSSDAPDSPPPEESGPKPAGPLDSSELSNPRSFQQGTGRR